MTKSFTGAALMSLVVEGSVRLDEPVATYVPELAGWRGPTADGPPLTVRHLVSMESGLPTDDPWADRHLDLPPDGMDALIAGRRDVHLDPRHALRVLQPRLGDRRPRDRTGRRGHAATACVRAIPDAARHDEHDVDTTGRRQRRRPLPVGGRHLAGRARAARRRHDRAHGLGFGRRSPTSRGG